MGNDSRGLEAISDIMSPVASEVLRAAAGGVSSGIKESTSDIWGALVGDPLKIWRTRRLIDGLESVASHIRKKGLNLKDAKALPFGDMLILFDGISKEDDQTLSDMWARLIAECLIKNSEPSGTSDQRLRLGRHGCLIAFCGGGRRSGCGFRRL